MKVKGAFESLDLILFRTTGSLTIVKDSIYSPRNYRYIDGIKLQDYSPTVDVIKYKKNIHTVDIIKYKKNIHTIDIIKCKKNIYTEDIIKQKNYIYSEDEIEWELDEYEYADDEYEHNDDEFDTSDVYHSTTLPSSGGVGFHSKIKIRAKRSIVNELVGRGDGKQNRFFSEIYI